MKRLPLLTTKDLAACVVVDRFISNVFSFARVSGKNGFGDDRRHEGASGLSDQHFALLHSVSKRLGLTEDQIREIGNRIENLWPLIRDLRNELREKELSLVALQPGAIDFVTESARLSNEIGMLATQISLTSNILMADVYNFMTTMQQETLRELLIAIHSQDAIGE
ncbi:MAG: hypothetical protein QNJ11_08740 [Woeseiaceae bacterium]|nr:hypothetical protein [Woeseiaceae bacterium]